MASENNNQIFRQKSMDQLSTPDQLTEYLRVTGAGVWIMLAGIIILLAGLLIWGLFGRIISSVTVPAEVKNGVVSCYVLADDIDLGDHTIDVVIGDVKLTAKPEDSSEELLDATADPELYKSGYLSAGKKVEVLTTATELKDGFYQAEVTTETIKPLSLLFSRN
jgi:hypothetical protein